MSGLGDSSRAAYERTRLRRIREADPVRWVAILVKRKNLSAKRHPLRDVWAGIKQRCFNPNHVAWHRYGGRGIRLCERWMKFEAFVADMGPRPSLKHSIDRINNDGDYEPGNCRWILASENSRRRPTTTGLTEDSVYALRRVAALGLFPQRQMAAWWKISLSLAGKIIARKCWKHVP